MEYLGRQLLIDPVHGVLSQALILVDLHQTILRPGKGETISFIYKMTECFATCSWSRSSALLPYHRHLPEESENVIPWITDPPIMTIIDHCHHSTNLDICYLDVCVQSIRSPSGDGQSVNISNWFHAQVEPDHLNSYVRSSSVYPCRLHTQQHGIGY